MGEVYAARDTRLAREVALKVLHRAVTEDASRVRRFESEARSASALNHPNIVTIYDVGSSDSVSWIAMERVEGQTLRQAIGSSGLPTKKILTIAVQIADGLARAHEAGIVHRDLKPENVMLTKDNRVKILDFGLAKLAPAGATSGEESQWPAQTGTFPGVVLGTVGYMSPEQAQGGAVGHRSDQFSFGSVLYEMATGRRAFHGKSAIDTLAAIINTEPEPIERIEPRVPGPLRWVVERCLSKEPSNRYASTQDLAQELRVLRDHVTDISGTTAAGRKERRRRPRLASLLTAALVLAGLAGMYLAGKRAGQTPIPDFQRLTFQRGWLGSARFAPDGRTIVYAGSFDREPAGVFTTRTDGRGATRLGLPEAGLLSVSSQGELALSLNGTLARVPLVGGAPREMIEGVDAADWTPDGKGLLIVRGGKIEHPIGKVLFETSDLIRSPRFSPAGDRIAFLVEHANRSDISVETVDLSGKHSVLTRDWKRASNLAWSPDGEEVWFGANESGWRVSLYAVSRTGKVRLVMRLPALIRLQDVARDGRVLVSLSMARASLHVMRPGDAREQDLSWHESSFAKDLTPDGKTLLFDEGAEGYFHAIYVRPMDGSPAKHIGEGRAMAISPDGRWALTSVKDRGSELVLLPTGAGEPRPVDTGEHGFAEADFSRDGTRLLLEADGGPTYLKDLPTGKLSPVAPEETQCWAFSPDGRQAACADAEGKGLIYPADGGHPRAIPGFAEGDRPVQWSSDGRSLYVGAFHERPPRIFRLDLVTGKRALWRELTPDDPSTMGNINYFTMTSDGSTFAYSSQHSTGDLYMVTGLR
jgi:Tol biopolymer transport system component/predicted Ser/Thr protein kinase